MSDEAAVSFRIPHGLVVKAIGVIVGALATAYFTHREVAQKELTRAQANWDYETATLIVKKLERIEAKLEIRP